MQNLSDEDKIILGNEAKQILSSHIVRDAFATIENDAMEKLIACPPEDDALRFRLAERVKVIRDLKQALQTVQNTGQITQQRIDAED